MSIWFDFYNWVINIVFVVASHLFYHKFSFDLAKNKIIFIILTNVTQCVCGISLEAMQSDFGNCMWHKYDLYGKCILWNNHATDCVCFFSSFSKSYYNVKIYLQLLKCRLIGLRMSMCGNTCKKQNKCYNFKINAKNTCVRKEEINEPIY